MPLVCLSVTNRGTEMTTMTLYRVRVHIYGKPYTVAFFVTRSYAENFANALWESCEPKVDEVEISLDELSKIY